MKTVSVNGGPYFPLPKDGRFSVSVPVNVEAYIACNKGHILAQALPDGRALFKHGGRMAIATDVYCERCKEWFTVSNSKEDLTTPS